MDWSTKPDGKYQNKKTGETITVQGGRVVPQQAPAPAPAAAPAPSPAPAPAEPSSFDAPGPRSGRGLGEQILRNVTMPFSDEGSLPYDTQGMTKQDLVDAARSGLQGVTRNYADEIGSSIEAAGNSMFSDKTYAAEKARLEPQYEKAYSEAVELQPAAGFGGSMVGPNPAKIMGAASKVVGPLGRAAGRVALGGAEGAAASYGADADVGLGTILGAGGQALGEVGQFIFGKTASKAASAAPPTQNGGPLIAPPKPRAYHEGGHFKDTAPTQIATAKDLQFTNAGSMPAPKVAPTPKAAPVEQPYSAPQTSKWKEQIKEFVLKKLLPGSALAGGTAAVGAAYDGDFGKAAKLGLGAGAAALLSKANPQMAAKVGQAIEASASTPQKAASLLQAMNEDEDFRAERRKQLGVD